jgi:hypothetical protein
MVLCISIALNSNRLHDTPVLTGRVAPRPRHAKQQGCGEQRYSVTLPQHLVEIQPGSSLIDGRQIE